jgi:hypothetical protein
MTHVRGPEGISRPWPSESTDPRASKPHGRRPHSCGAPQHCPFEAIDATRRAIRRRRRVSAASQPRG